MFSFADSLEVALKAANKCFERGAAPIYWAPRRAASEQRACARLRAGDLRLCYKPLKESLM